MLSDARLTHGKIKAMGNPRRLFLHVEDLSERQPDEVRVVTGPPKRAAFDAEGKPTKAAEGFAKGQGVGVEELKIIETDKGEYISVTVEEKGAQTAAVLSELLPKVHTFHPVCQVDALGRQGYKVRPPDTLDISAFRRGNRPFRTGRRKKRRAYTRAQVSKSRVISRKGFRFVHAPDQG